MRNGENQRKRERVREIEAEADAWGSKVKTLEADMERLAERLSEAQERMDAALADLATAQKDASQLEDESTAEIEAALSEVEEANARVRDNAARMALVAEADELEGAYADMGDQIETARSERRRLLEGAELPLDGLSVEDGRLVYMNQPWDCMSASEQMRAATAIVRATKPECGFVLVDKLEQMDPQTMREFGEWAAGEGLQLIATRVGDGSDCTIVIEDGRAVAAEGAGAAPMKAGEFNFPGKER